MKAAGIILVPTLRLINNQGLIVREWIGELIDAEQSEILGEVEAESVPDTGLSAADSINATELKEAIDKSEPVVILDVRDREDFAEGHIPGSKNIPLDELEIRALDELSSSGLIVPYCRCSNDGLSKIAARILKLRKFPRILTLHGGIDSWQQAQLPISSRH